MLSTLAWSLVGELGTGARYAAARRAKPTSVPPSCRIQLVRARRSHLAEPQRVNAVRMQSAASPTTPLAPEIRDDRVVTPTVEASVVATPPTAAASAPCSILDLEERVAADDAELRRLLRQQEIIARRVASTTAQLSSSREELARARLERQRELERWARGRGLLQSPAAVAQILGQPEPYSHQIEAVLPVLHGDDTWDTYPAGSGKSLIIHMLAALSPGQVLLVVGPLLALAHEQCASAHLSLGKYVELAGGARRQTAYVLGGANKDDFSESIGEPPADLEARRAATLRGDWDDERCTRRRCDSRSWKCSKRPLPLLRLRAMTSRPPRARRPMASRPTQRPCRPRNQTVIRMGMRLSEMALGERLNF